MRSCLGRIARFVSARKVADGDMGCTGGGCAGRRSADMGRGERGSPKEATEGCGDTTNGAGPSQMLLFGRVSEEDARYTPPLPIGSARYLGGSTCRQPRRGCWLAAGQEEWRAKKCHVVQKMAYERAHFASRPRLRKRTARRSFLSWSTQSEQELGKHAAFSGTRDCSASHSSGEAANAYIWCAVLAPAATDASCTDGRV